MLLFDVAILTTCLFIVFQDGKYRSIAVWTVLSLALLMFIRGTWVEADTSVYDMVLNLVFLLVQLLGLTLYFSIKTRRWILPFDRYIGWGDVLFFAAVGIGMPNIKYILFIILALLVAIVTYGFIIFFFKNARKEVPLAGIAAFCLAISIMLDRFNNGSQWMDALQCYFL